MFSQKWIIIQLWNQYHCDQHAWKPQGTLEFGPPNTKESDILAQNVFSQKWIIAYSFDTCTIVISMPEKPQGLLSLALQIQRKVMFYSKMCFFRNGSLYNFETCTIVISMPENLRVCTWVWPSKYKGKWCFIPKCVFSEMDHCITLKLVPLWLACLETSVCT